ncbi:MAG TPA: LysR family substrate-binding domain-containing protein [Longimicrobiales bacterium]|nr:LysR family substrate-binding domain-containing protein [Longimicrobiales bacterium]
MHSEAHREPQREALARGELDLGLFTLRAGDGDFEGVRLAADALVAVLPSAHLLAPRKRVDLAALEAEPWVLFPVELRTEYVRLVIEACAARGFMPRVVQEASQLHTLVALVSAGLGVTLIPRSVAAVPRHGVVVRPLAHAAPALPLHVVWRRDALNAAGAGFVAVARALADSGPEARG